MARTKGNSLELCPEYQEYRAGFQGSGKRWPYDQPFERNNNGEVIIPQGEVFCRMPALGQGKILCTHDTAQLPQNLKMHIRKVHPGTRLPDAKRGASSSHDLALMKNFWRVRLAQLKSYHMSGDEKNDKDNEYNEDDEAEEVEEDDEDDEAQEVEEDDEVEGDDDYVSEEEEGASGHSRPLPGLQQMTNLPRFKSGPRKNALKVEEMRVKAGIKRKGVCNKCLAKGNSECPLPDQPTYSCNVWKWYIQELAAAEGTEDWEGWEDVEDGN